MSAKPRFRKWVMHVMANCRNCDWSSHDYQKGQAEAARHARKTGHEIEGELGYAFRYETSSENGRDSSG
jgi:hypothetical protein